MIKRLTTKAWLGTGLVLLCILPGVALAAEVDTGDTAWMITATVLVLFMTIPGLSLFYAVWFEARMCYRYWYSVLPSQH